LNRDAVGFSDGSSVNSSPSVSTQKLAEKNNEAGKEVGALYSGYSVASYVVLKTIFSFRDKI